MRCNEDMQKKSKSLRVKRKKVIDQHYGSQKPVVSAKSVNEPPVNQLPHQKMFEFINRYWRGRTVR